MKSPARRFTLIMLAVSVLFVGLPVLLNYLVDPYDRFGNNTMGVFIMAERELKPSEVVRFPHNALMIGNSRIASIPAVKVNGFKFFNASFAAATPEEIYYFLERYAHKQELVVLGIDMGAKDPAAPQGDIFKPGDFASVREHLVNLQTTEYSLKTVFSHWGGHPSRYLPDGSLAAPEWGNAGKLDDPTAGKRYLDNMKTHTVQNVVPAPRSLSFYRKIADTLRARNIPVVVVMPPIHEAVFRHVGEMNLHDLYEAWVAEVTSIFPNVVNLTDSPYGSATNFYLRDPLHYKPETGVQFMNEVVVPYAQKVLAERRPR
ncbi:MAG: hypothetical protein WCK55_04175 [Verrucomicrobiota bacterium]